MTPTSHPLSPHYDFAAALRERHERPRLLAIAHRAGNDLARLRVAEEIGVDLIETDLWYFRRRLEARHVKTLGPVPVLWDRWRLEPGWRPRLQLFELLATVGERTTLFLDLKGRHPGLPGALREALGRLGKVRPVVVCSQRWHLLDALLPYPELGLVYSIGNPRMLRDVWPRLDRLEQPAVSIDQRLLTPETVRAFKERSAAVVTWTVNDEARADELRAWGVDGVISDNVELLPIRGPTHPGARVHPGAEGLRTSCAGCADTRQQVDFGRYCQRRGHHARA